MLGSEEIDPEGIEATAFDLARLDDLAAGRSLESETGTWKCIRYPREYVLVEQIGRRELRTFKKLGQLKHFLMG